MQNVDGSEGASNKEDSQVFIGTILGQHKQTLDNAEFCSSPCRNINIIDNAIRLIITFAINMYCIITLAKNVSAWICWLICDTRSWPFTINQVKQVAVSACEEEEEE